MPDTEVLEKMTPRCILPRLRVGSKRQLLQELSRRAAEITGRPEGAVLAILEERENLGSTGMGHGVAIPHGRINGLDRLYGVFARLEKPIGFDSVDDKPVDLVFLLLTPPCDQSVHLRALAEVSRRMRDAQLCSRLRACDSSELLLDMLKQAQSADAA